MKKRIVRTLSSIVDHTVLLTLLVSLIFASYCLWDSRQVYAAADPNRFEEYKPEEDNLTKFEELRAMNPDVIGWLTVYDTKIDYPVLRSPKSNDDYLSKNPMGEWESSGSLFLDHNNKADFSDFNTIIFGHHMEQRKMFGDIDEFLDMDFFEKHEFANLYCSRRGLSPNLNATGLKEEFTSYQGQNYGIQFFAMIQADGYDQSIYRVPSQTELAKQETLNTIAKDAIVVRNLNTKEVKLLGTAGAKAPKKTDNVNADFFGVTPNDRIVLMSTCSADITNGRFVLVGKLLDYEVPNPFPEETNEGGQLDVFSFIDKVLERPLWQWIAILIAAIILIYLLYKAERYRLKKKRERKEARE